MPSSLYTNTPLTAPDSIRLLVLYPSSPATCNSPLQGHLQVTTLSELDLDLVGTYTALSYVWGDPNSEAAFIQLRDASHPPGGGEDETEGETADTAPLTASSSPTWTCTRITPTLASALRDLRDPTRRRRIWADALCIDQGNVAERNSQVALMARIYATADNTVVHLGSSRSGDSDGCTPPLTSAAELISKAYLARGRRPSPEDRKEAVRAAKKSILTRPWFRRVWVFQELVVSKDPWVQAGPGHTKARWSDLANLILDDPQRVPAANSSDVDDDEDATDTEGAKGLAMFADMNRATMGSHPGNLFGLLKMRRGLGATDPRDFVYANLGLAADAAPLLASVDYSLPVGVVFAAAARHILSGAGVEALLYAASETGTDGHDDQRRRQSDIPSWAPDWRVSAGYSTAMYRDTMRSRERLSSAPKVVVEEDTLVLPWLGYTVGVVRDVSAVLPAASSVLSKEAATRYSAITSEIDGIYRANGGVYYSGDANGRYVRVSLRGRETRHEELCLALGEEVGRLLNGLLADPGSEDGRDSDLASIPAAASARSTLIESHERFSSFYQAWWQARAAEQRIAVGAESEGIRYLTFRYMRYPDAAPEQVLQGRRLASASLSGADIPELCGVVPAGVRPGDVIAYLAGSEVAYLLRSIAETGAREGGQKRRDADEKIYASFVDAGAVLDVHAHAANGGDILWEAAQSATDKVRHFLVVGECYFDGVIGWALGDRPRIDIMALH